MSERGHGVGWMVKQLKAGKRVTRPGWNGKGMYLYLHAYSASYYDDAAEPCVVMHTAQGKEQPGWLASQPDLLATDWTLVDGEEEHEEPTVTVMTERAVRDIVQAYIEGCTFEVTHKRPGGEYHVHNVTVVHPDRFEP